MFKAFETFNSNEAKLLAIENCSDAQTPEEASPEGHQRDIADSAPEASRGQLQI